MLISRSESEIMFRTFCVKARATTRRLHTSVSYQSVRCIFLEVGKGLENQILLHWFLLYINIFDTYIYLYISVDRDKKWLQYSNFQNHGNQLVNFGKISLSHSVLSWYELVANKQACIRCCITSLLERSRCSRRAPTRWLRRSCHWGCPGRNPSTPEGSRAPGWPP